MTSCLLRPSLNREGTFLRQVFKESTRLIKEAENDRAASPVNVPLSSNMALARIHLHFFTPYSIYCFLKFSSHTLFAGEIYDGSQSCSGRRS